MEMLKMEQLDELKQAIKEAEKDDTEVPIKLKNNKFVSLPIQTHYFLP